MRTASQGYALESVRKAVTVSCSVSHVCCSVMHYDAHSDSVLEGMCWSQLEA